MEYFRRLVLNWLYPQEKPLTRQIYLKQAAITQPTPQNSQKLQLTTVSETDLRELKRLCGIKGKHIKQRGEMVGQLAHTEHKKILLLDLDKTLIYYSERLGFFKRPHLKLFLNSLADLYDIYIFTAATNEYAKKMQDRISADLANVKGLFHRKNCTIIEKGRNNKIYVKDLKIFANCDIEKIVIVDDNPNSYVLNPVNAIPIAPFKGDYQDQELLKMINILKDVSRYSDIRNYIKDKYIPQFPEQSLRQ